MPETNYVHLAAVPPWRTCVLWMATLALIIIEHQGILEDYTIY
jgi:hypothetical protein